MTQQAQTVDDALNQIIESMKQTNQALVKKLTSQNEVIERLVGALEKYGHHSTPEHHCAHLVHSQNNCDCGFDEALAFAREHGAR